MYPGQHISVIIQRLEAALFLTSAKRRNGMTTMMQEPQMKEPQNRGLLPPTNNKALRQSVFDVLTCPLCKEYMSPPITLCQAGHNICSRCRPSMQFTGGNKCPRCRRQLLDTRNVALETIARGLKYPCRYSDVGCREKFTMDEINKHHARCSHRCYDCPLREFEKCYWNGRMAEVREHIEKKHPTNALATPLVECHEEVSWEISNAECYQNSQHVVFVLDEVFLFHKRFDIPQRKLCVAVQHCWEIGDEEKAFRYSFHLEKNDGRQSALLSNKVHNATEDLEQVFVSGESMKVDFDMLMNFVKGSRTMRIMATKVQTSML